MTETTVTTATPVTLKRAAARLHAARDRVESLSNTWSALLDTLRDQYADLLHQIDEAKIDAREAEDALRAARLREFEATGSKSKLFGVGISSRTSFEYDQRNALNWARAHNHEDLIVPESLNTKEFEKVAKVLKPSFVKIIETPIVTLPSDSAKLLGEG